MNIILDEAQQLADYAQRLRRDFHQHPELGHQEFRTAGIVAAELRQLGLEVTTGVGKTGVVALIEGSTSGPVLMLRFDMDALPIQEQTGAEYTSNNPGVMHACGHDGHVAIGLTVARLLHHHRKELAGTIKLVFQPAEEGLGGAEGMIADGVLENPKPDYCFGVHVWNEKPVGWMSATAGAMMAGSEIFTIQLTGHGGHGAVPHASVDPVVAAAHIITALQTVVSRNVSPLQTAVVTVTVVKAGEAFNVIPHTAELRGTIRTFEPAVRKKVLQRVQEIASGIAQAMGCTARVEIQSMTPALINNEALAERILPHLHAQFPGMQIATTFQTMGSEDMAFFMQQVPGVFFMVGSANAEKGLNFGHHHPQFDFDEAALPTATAVVASAALQILKG